MSNSSYGIKMYGTEYCHLCDAAAEILESAGVAAQKIDIVDDEALMARYGIRIPVLARSDSGAELNWPFDVAAVRSFVA